MGIVHAGIPKDVVLDLKKRLHLDTFVETGTFHGATTEWAAGHFSQVITVELSPSLHAQAARKLQHLANIQCLFGDSRTTVPRIVATLHAPALFWLDGHWTASAGAAGEEAECPLLKELDAINRSAVDHLILIDDVRFFASPPPLPHRPAHWPTLERISAILSARGRSVHIVDDVMYAAAPSAKATVAEYFHARGHDRRTLKTVLRAFAATLLRRPPRDRDRSRDRRS